jgi:hypothetical protein
MYVVVFPGAHMHFKPMTYKMFVAANLKTIFLNLEHRLNTDTKVI